MLFNSLTFAIFLPIVFFCYWFLFHKNKHTQNLLLAGASFFFYSCWDARFSFLLLFSVALNYVFGLLIHNGNIRSRKTHMIIAASINISVLFFFKYFNFFIESFSSLLSNLGISSSVHTLAIILPVGISFYTFHGLSYIFDIYNKKIEPTKNFVDYSLFVSYFPLLVAGPIERATHLLPQLAKKRTFNYLQATEGLKQILWGLFKKIAISDLCAEYVNIIFENHTDHSASTLFLGAFYFTIQIYCDFSGYSDIALGTSKLFGINLLKNFNYPYFSRSIAEFWRRWHISLSSWFRDYLYIPLGGSKRGMAIAVRNTFIIFLVSGFWHGANWTFIAWGAINALYIMPSILLKQNRKNLDTVAEGRLLPSLKEVGNMSLTFLLTILAWILFRATSISHATDYIVSMADWSFFSLPEFINYNLLILITLLFVIEWIGREKNFALEQFASKASIMFRWAFYILLILAMLSSYSSFNNQGFIYFQF